MGIWAFQGWLAKTPTPPTMPEKGEEKCLYLPPREGWKVEQCHHRHSLTIALEEGGLSFSTSTLLGDRALLSEAGRQDLPLSLPVLLGEEERDMAGTNKTHTHNCQIYGSGRLLWLEEQKTDRWRDRMRQIIFSLLTLLLILLHHINMTFFPSIIT